LSVIGPTFSSPVVLAYKISLWRAIVECPSGKARDIQHFTIGCCEDIVSYEILIGDSWTRLPTIRVSVLPLLQQISLEGLDVILL